MPCPYRPLELLIIVNTNLKKSCYNLQSYTYYYKVKANRRDTGLCPVLLTAPGTAGPRVPTVNNC